QTIQNVAPTNYALATEIATTRTLVKGYSDTHERGRQRYDTLMQMLPRIMETPDPAAALAALRKAALADDAGTALNVAIRELRPLPQAAEYLRHHRRRFDFQSRLGLEQPADLHQRHGREMIAQHRAIG